MVRRVKHLLKAFSPPSAEAPLKMPPDLIIDPALKYWVLLPISLALILFAVLRHTVNTLLSPTPKLQPLVKTREQEHLRRAALFKQNFSALPKAGFESRQFHIVDQLTNGSLLAEQPSDTPPNPLTDATSNPEMMMDMMKNQFGNMFAQTAMMWWVNFFFFGFVLMKLPFPLTLRFKQMLQTGVATDDLDVRWVSSISWYFIATMGLNSVMNVLFKDDSIAQQLQQQMMQQQQQPQMGMGAPQPDKVMAAEANNIQIIPYEYVLESVEERLLAQY